MINNEKVIKGLEETEIMLSHAIDRGGEMAVIGACKCLNRVSDALAMLKDQRTVVQCKDCIYADDFDCPAPLPTGYSCQKGHGSHLGDWFCADGKERQEEIMSEGQIELLKKALALYAFAVDQIAEFDERNEFFLMVEELSRIVGTDLHS